MKFNSSRGALALRLLVVLFLLIATANLAYSQVPHKVKNNTTVGKLMKEQGIKSFSQFKKLNPDLEIRNKMTKLSSGTTVYLPIQSDLYTVPFKAGVQGQYFWNPGENQFSGFSWNTHASYLHYLNRKKIGWAFGGFADFTAVSRSGFENELYQETGFIWTAGVIGHYKWPSSDVEALIGSGHLHYVGKLATSYQDKSDVIPAIVGVTYHTYQDRQVSYQTNKGTNWFNNTKIYAKYVFPFNTKNDFDLARANPELFPNYLKVGGEAAILDIVLSRKYGYLMPLAFETNLIMYDFDDLKTVTEYGFNLSLLNKKDRIVKIFGKSQEGSYATGNRRFIVGLEIDIFDWLFR